MPRAGRGGKVAIRKTLERAEVFYAVSGGEPAARANRRELRNESFQRGVVGK